MDHVRAATAAVCKKFQSNTTSGSSMAGATVEEEDDMMGLGSGELRRGPWMVEEDFTLINYIAHHGEGRWNSLARCAGLKRTGKSCRLRWLNYLRPDVQRGNITLEEQLLILELHSRWGNRWSKIAQHLPGRTDNEIKNYWRTRVQKHAKQLKCDVNSKQFKDTMRYLWMPRLVERIQAAAAAAASSTSATPGATSNYAHFNHNHNVNVDVNGCPNDATTTLIPPISNSNTSYNNYGGFSTPEISSTGNASSDSFATQFSPVSDLTDCYNNSSHHHHHHQDYYYQLPSQQQQKLDTTALTSPTGYLFNQGGLDHPYQVMEQSSPWMDSGDVSDNLWSVEDVWFSQHQINYDI